MSPEESLKHQPAQHKLLVHWRLLASHNPNVFLCFSNCPLKTGISSTPVKSTFPFQQSVLSINFTMQSSQRCEARTQEDRTAFNFLSSPVCRCPRYCKPHSTLTSVLQSPWGEVDCGTFLLTHTLELTIGDWVRAPWFLLGHGWYLHPLKCLCKFLGSTFFFSKSGWRLQTVIWEEVKLKAVCCHIFNSEYSFKKWSSLIFLLV